MSALIQEKRSVTLGLITIGRLLHELGITSQKPLRHAYERNPSAIEN